MYCVKCGVKLQEGVPACPLCATPVWNPDGTAPAPERTFGDRYPEAVRHTRSVFAVLLTVLNLIAVLVITLICLKLHCFLRWGNYVLFGLILGYCVAVLPLWFRRPNPVVFLPVNHAAVLLYLFYICLKAQGHWFWSFAFPVVLCSAVLLTALAALLRYTRGGRFFIFGGFMLLSAGYMVLIELFESLSFGFTLLRWSPYPAAACAILGIFLLLAGIIRPLGNALRKTFYI